MGGLMMRSFALIEGDQATMLHVRHDGDATVFDRDRESAIRFRIAMHADRDTTWRMLSRVMDGLVRAEDRLIRIERLVARVKAGWRPVPGEIDPEIPQRTLRQAHFAVDAIAFPDDPDDPDFYAPPTKLLGIGESGYVEPTGHILWIDAYREWAVCDDGFWWMPWEDQ
jgi:hypothetical protein